jgi:hypothetical protein
VVSAAKKTEPRSSAVAKPPPSKTSPLRYVAIGVGVVAVGAAGFGAWQGLGAMSDASAVKANPNATPQQIADVRSRSRLADYGYIAAGALAATALILLVVSGRSASPPPMASDEGFGASLKF